MVKKGDTLIEVTIAVGIFAMVAISIVAVMSGGTSSAQSALETTLTREEIDAQAEALRFIQTAYIADRDTVDTSVDGNDRYIKLWKAITARAIELRNSTDEDILKYAPASCSELYDTTHGEVFAHDLETGKGPFILNYRKLGDFTDISTVLKSSTNNVGEPQTDDFTYASTYPHIIYTETPSNSNKTEENASLVASTFDYSFYRAEGIYIVAVKDKNTTTLTKDGKTSAFYDFYIRTCWYGTDANQPSTISTVIRLYDPDALKNSF